MIVVTISLIPHRARRIAGIAVHRAPATHPATSAITHTAGREVASNQVPATAAASAPIRTWPSIPMFQSPALAATNTASPAINSGVARTRISCNPAGRSRVRSNNSEYARTGSWPVRMRTTAAIANAIATAASDSTTGFSVIRKERAASSPELFRDRGIALTSRSPSLSHRPGRRPGISVPMSTIARRTSHLSGHLARMPRPDLS